MLVAGINFVAGGRVFAAIGSNPAVAFINQGYGFFSGQAIAIDTDAPAGNNFNAGMRINPNGAVYGTATPAGTDIYCDGLRISNLGQVVYESADAVTFVNGNPITAAGLFAVN